MLNRDFTLYIRAQIPKYQNRELEKYSVFGAHFCAVDTKCLSSARQSFLDSESHYLGKYNMTKLYYDKNMNHITSIKNRFQAVLKYTETICCMRNVIPATFTVLRDVFIDFPKYYELKLPRRVLDYYSIAHNIYANIKLIAQVFTKLHFFFVNFA